MTGLDKSTLGYASSCSPIIISNIPDPRFWAGDFPESWIDLAEKICPKCNKKLGYNILVETLSDGTTRHCGCRE